MFVIPRPLLLDYQSRLIQQNISPRQRADFHKWLRYYFDFCVNHGVPVDNPDSFRRFDQKLIETRWTEENRLSARAAITLFYDSKGVLPVATTKKQNAGRPRHAGRKGFSQFSSSGNKRRCHHPKSGV